MCIIHYKPWMQLLSSNVFLFSNQKKEKSGIFCSSWKTERHINGSSMKAHLWACNWKSWKAPGTLVQTQTGNLLLRSSSNQESWRNLDLILPWKGSNKMMKSKKWGFDLFWVIACNATHLSVSTHTPAFELFDCFPPASSTLWISLSQCWTGKSTNLLRSWLPVKCRPARWITEFHYQFWFSSSYICMPMTSLFVATKLF